MAEELFVLRDGKAIMDEGLSMKMAQIKESKPEFSYEWNEMGMAELFSELYRKEARYCIQKKAWYTYYDGQWRKDENALLVSAKLKEFVRLMILYCGEIVDDDARKKYTGFISKMGDRRLRDRTLKDATDTLMIDAAEFDADPYLINCLNGVYDLKDFTFREHSYKDYLTMSTRFNHTVSREVRCDRWEKFIDEVTEGDKDKADFLQRALGYSILGTSHEECMFILHGKTTRNGKSTLLNTIEHILGDYSTVAPIGLICASGKQKDADSASPTLAALKGKRFVTLSESNQYGKLDEEQIKVITGGEEISARALYEKPITFRPQFTMWLSCNDLPRVTDKSLFASDRLRLIEFNRHFSAKEQDKHLKDEFMTPEAMSGIFMWLVRGYRAYLSHGLEVGESLLLPVRQYEKDNDVILQFLEEKCEMGDSFTVGAKELYDTFKIWAKQNGYRTSTSRKFYAGIESHADWCKKKYKSAGRVKFEGFYISGLSIQ